MGDEIVPVPRTRLATEARRRGWVALAAAGVTVAVSLTLGAVPWGLGCAAATGYLGWRWLSFRIRNGLRF